MCIDSGGWGSNGCGSGYGGFGMHHNQHPRPLLINSKCHMFYTNIISGENVPRFVKNYNH